MSRIFVSHSSANNAEAIAIRDWMMAHGWDDVFLDLDPERGLKAGERWQEALKRAADRCELVVFLVSPVWAASKWCLAEFLLAKSLNKRVFAVIVEPTPFSELPTEMTAEWQITDLTTGARDYRVTVTLPGGKTKDVALGTEGLDRLRIGLAQSGLDPKYFAWPPANDPDRPPYRGLWPLEADDAGIFFGREAAVLDALDRLRGLREAPPPRLLVILGASGSGKSSLLRAGLLPRLARDGRQFLALPIIRPERMAISGETGLLRALEGAFRAAKLSIARADLRAAIDGGPTKLGGLLSRLAQTATLATTDVNVTPKAPTLVLSIDQGEELFLSEGQPEAHLFLSLMHDLVTVEAPAVIALFTIRSDNYERLQLAKELEGVRQQTLSLPPMPKGSYADVIKRPAQRLEGTPRALRIDDALVDALLADIEAGGAKDALPLLAFTLERLYGEYGGTGHLKLEHYEKLGRLKGSIEAAIERAFRAADTDPKVPKDRQARLALLRRGLIPWLAGIDPDTGAPRRRVARLSEIPAEARPLIDLLIEQRLLSTDVAKDTMQRTVEPAHEALLRQWDSLQDWLKEDAPLLTLLDGIKRAARDWAANGRQPAWLAHAAGRLVAAERLQERSDLAASLERMDREYLDACQTHETEQINRQRRVLGRTFVKPALQALENGLNESALRLVAAGALLAKDIDLVLVPELWRPAPEAIVQSRTQAVLKGSYVLFSSDWKRVSTLSAKTASLWDAETGTEIAVLKGHEVTSAAFTPDGKRIVTASGDGTARLWDTETGAEIAVLKGHEGIVRSASFSPDGRRIVTASDDCTARLWDTESGAEIAVLRGHLKKVVDAEFSPDGSRVATASDDNAARLWHAVTGAEIAVFKGHEKSVFEVAFSPDGKRVATMSDDNTARLWDTKTGAELAVFKEHNEEVFEVAFSPDGKRVATASGTRLWDAETGTEIAVLKGHEDRVSSVSFSPDGKRVLTTSWDRTTRLWDAETATELAVLKGHEGRVNSASFSLDGKRIVTASIDHTARLWDAETGAQIGVFSGHEKEVVYGWFSPDGKRVATESEDNTARVWDADTGPEIAVLKNYENVFSAAFSPDGKRVATASQSGTAKVWDAETAAEIVVLKGHKDEVRSASFSLDGRRIVTASDDRTARLWDAETGAEIAVLEGHEDAVRGSCFSPDGKRVATASYDGTARLWNAETGAEVALFRRHETVVLEVGFSPDGNCVVITSDRHTARLWDAETAAKIAVFKGHEGRLRSASLSPDCKLMVTMAWDQIARLWDAETGAEIAVLEGHEGIVRSASFSLDGRRIVTASDDGTARLWDAETGAEIAVLEGHEDTVWSARFSPDGRCVATASYDGTARLWDVSRSAVVVGGRALVLTAALARGIGTRTVNESTDFLMQDAPDDLFSAALALLGGRASALAETVAALHAPLHPNCYLSPTEFAAKFGLPPPQKG